MARIRMAPNSTTELLELIRKSAVHTPVDFDSKLTQLPCPLSDNVRQAGETLVNAEILTRFQLKQLLKGKHRGLRLSEYRVLEKVGVGGMGAVYLAEDEALHRPAAIKVLTSASKKNPLAVERFAREARAAAALVHPNIVGIYKFGEYQKIDYLAMEYVPGKTLDQLVSEEQPMDACRASFLIAQVAAGLQHAHEQGFIHRDIKPSNLIVTGRW